MAERISFGYGEFYDYPRQVDFQFDGEWFYLSSAFNEQIDDYPDYYEVFLLPFRTEEEFKANPYYWRDLSNASHLGQIAIADVGLDPTRRRSIDACAFEKWLSARKHLLDADAK